MMRIGINVGRVGWLAPAVLAAVLGVTGCHAGAKAQAGPADEPAATVEEADGAKPARITLSDRAVRRLSIRTEQVKVAPKASGGGSGSLVVPYGALVYDADGEAWVFVSPEPRTYMRAPIKVATIKSDSVILTSGPPAGTPVVTVGAPELVGAEAGISGEE